MSVTILEDLYNPNAISIRDAINLTLNRGLTLVTQGQRVQFSIEVFKPKNGPIRVRITHPPFTQNAV